MKTLTARVLTPLIAVTFFALVAALVIGFLARMDVIVRASGELRPLYYADIRPPVEGRVIEVFKREGDMLKAGDAILVMDTESERLSRDKVRREIDRLTVELKRDGEIHQAQLAAKLEHARKSVKTAEADVERNKALLEEALSALKQEEASPDAIEVRNADEKLRQQEIAEQEAKKNFEDAPALFKLGAISENNVLKYKAAYETAQSETRVRRNSLEMLKQTKIGMEIAKARAHTEGQRAALNTALARLEERREEVKIADLARQDDSEARRLKADLEKAKLEEERLNLAIADKTLRTPISGILYDFHTKPGQSVTHKDRTAWVYDVSGFLFYGRLKQVDLPAVSVGNPALLYFDALPYREEGTWDAEVIDVAQIAKPSSGQAGETVGPILGDTDTLTPQALVRLRVKDGDERNVRLRVGFTGQAEVIVGRASLIDVMFGNKKNLQPGTPAPKQSTQAPVP